MYRRCRTTAYRIVKWSEEGRTASMENPHVGTFRGSASMGFSKRSSSCTPSTITIIFALATNSQNESGYIFVQKFKLYRCSNFGSHEHCRKLLGLTTVLALLCCGLAGLQVSRATLEFNVKIHSIAHHTCAALVSVGLVILAPEKPLFWMKKKLCSFGIDPHLFRYVRQMR